jgi:CRISPR/Cas system-associated endonuclease Cas1
MISHGFITSIGPHHSNDKNEFNLVDDLIEAFRPIVDLHVADIDLTKEDAKNLSRGARKQLTHAYRKPVPKCSAAVRKRN